MLNVYSVINCCFCLHLQLRMFLLLLLMYFCCRKSRMDSQELVCKRLRGIPSTLLSLENRSESENLSFFLKSLLLQGKSDLLSMRVAISNSCFREVAIFNVTIWSTFFKAIFEVLYISPSNFGKKKTTLFQNNMAPKKSFFQENCCFLSAMLFWGSVTRKLGLDCLAGLWASASASRNPGDTGFPSEKLCFLRRIPSQKNSMFPFSRKAGTDGSIFQRIPSLPSFFL